MPDTGPILFVTRKWAPATGGMETWSLRLSEALAEHGPIDVIALAGRKNGMPPSAAALIGFGFTVLSRYMQLRQRPRVLHLGDMAIWPLALPALRWKATGIVLTAHGTDVSYHRRDTLKGRLYGCYLRLGARVLRRARVIANSHATARVTRETGWRIITVVPLATDFRPPPQPGEQPLPTRDILFAGRLVERKGCGWFIREVLSQLPPDIRLRVAGTCWDAAEKKALNDPRVDFLGPLDQAQLAREYAAALCVIVPNIEVASGEYEGFGLVAPEAAAAGGIVIAADHGGLRDAVVDGVTGILAKTGEARDWAVKIIEVTQWTEPRRADFQKHAMAEVRARFNWARVAADVRAVYGAVIADS